MRSDDLPLGRAGGGWLRAATSALDAVLFEQTPRIAAALAFLAGATALIATVTARPPPIPGLEPLEAIVDEWPEFTASVASLVLMALALGLARRLDAAWASAVTLLGFFSLYAFVRHDHTSLATLCALAAAALIAGRRAFFRHARLGDLAPSRRLSLLIAIVLTIACIGGLLWAAERPGFAEAPWWALLIDPGIGRPGRILGAALAAAGAFVFWQALIAPSRPKPAPSPPGDMARALAILSRAEAARPEAHLARLGDKTFVFAPSGDAFTMTTAYGGSLIAMGGPVGARAAWRETLSAFRAEAERLSLRPVVYCAAPDLLPELLDVGLSIEKIGETAVIPLERFSLSGKAKQDFRTARRRLAEREGASFSVEILDRDAPLMRELEGVSDAWLAAHRGGEKGFSLGRFDPDFLAGQPAAIVRIGGAAIAFATLWPTADKRWIAIDLMRYDPARSPPATMDFLITETLLWARQEGYASFDLGLAPLSGLGEDRNAPLFAKFGRLVYERGGAIYNFEGLRRFKEKFGPEWEPRYIAGPGNFGMPLILADVALLTSGGPLALVGAKR